MTDATATCERCGRRFATTTAAVGVTLALGEPVRCDDCRADSEGE